MQAVISRFSADTGMLCEIVARSPLFRKDRQPVLYAGVGAYLAGDCIVAVHLLVPEVESAIRTLVAESGEPILRRSRSGDGVMYRTLDDLLRSETIDKVYGCEMAIYLRTLFTDARGWNVRNDICHGILPASMVGAMVVDRVLHAVFCLSIVRDGNACEEE